MENRIQSVRFDKLEVCDFVTSLYPRIAPACLCPCLSLAPSRIHPLHGRLLPLEASLPPAAAQSPCLLSPRASNLDPLGHTKVKRAKASIEVAASLATWAPAPCTCAGNALCTYRCALSFPRSPDVLCEVRDSPLCSWCAAPTNRTSTRSLARALYS